VFEAPMSFVLRFSLQRAFHERRPRWEHRLHE
jgi:hypothetical protein